MTLTGGAAGAALLRGQAAPAPIRSMKLSDRITLLYGDGGNVAIIDSPEGLMMIDGGFPERSADLLKTVSADVNSKKIQTVFNTHWHVDHIGCNETLGREGAKIIAQENVKKRLSVRTTMESLNRTFDPLKPEGLPKQIFTKGGRMNWGKERIEYVHVPTAHTDGDTYLFFPGPNILHTGDLMFNGTYPVIDYSTGGWIGGMAEASDVLLKVGDSKTRIIPGHGPMAAKEDLKQTRDMLAAIHDRLEKLIQEGKSLDEAVAAAPTRDFDDLWGKGSMKPEVFTRVAYTSIRRHSEKS